MTTVNLRIPSFPLSPRDVWGLAIQEDLLALKDAADPAVGLDSSVAALVGGTGETGTALGATYAMTTATLAIQRLDRQNTASVRSGGGGATIAYSDSTETTKDWADLSGWQAAANAQVAGNRLYAVDQGNPAGVLKSFPVMAGQRLRLTTLLYWKPGSTTAPAYFGVDFGAPDHAPVASSPDGAFIGFRSDGVRSTFSGANVSSLMQNMTSIGAEPTVSTTYQCSIDVDENFISFQMRSVGGTDAYTAYISRATLAQQGKTLNNLVLWVQDNRGASGNSFGPVCVVRSNQPVRTKTLAGQTIEGVAHRHVVTAAGSGADAWRYAVPASYDSRKPSPVVIYCHQSLTGNQHTAFSETRANPVTSALGDAGFFVAAANDMGDRWGNQASLDNYLALYKHLRGKFNTGPLFFLGISMGSLSILNGIVRGAFPTPAAVATIGGVVNLDDLWNNNTGSYAPGIRTAYGIASDGSDYATKTAGFNPAKRKGSEFRGVPMRLYTSTGDTTVPKVTNQDALSALVAPYAPESTVVLGSGGHLDISQWQPSDLVSFFQRYA